MKKIRYCRQCGKELDKSHYFFCNDTCMKKFSDNYVSAGDMEKATAALNLLVGEVEKPRDTCLPLCEQCKKRCKTKVPKEFLDTLISFECFNFKKKENKN